MRIFIPNGLDLSGLTKTQADTSAFLLHQLVRKNKAAGRIMTEPHALHRDILYSIAGKEYRYLVGILEHRGILAVGSSYSVGRTSKQYNLVRSAALVPYVVSDSLTLKRIKAARQIQTKYTLLLNPQLQQQANFIKTLTIDQEATKNKVQGVYGYTRLIKTYKKMLASFGTPQAKELALAFIQSNTLEKKRLRQALKLTTEEYQWLNSQSEQYRKLVKRITEINSWAAIGQDKKKDQWLRLTTSKRTGRVFSNMTSTPKDVRTELRSNGKPLVELDAASCQWAMLVHLLQERNTYKYVGNIKELNSKLEVLCGGSKPHQLTIPLTPLPIICVSFTAELDKLASLVSTGRLNSYMHQRTLELGNSYNRGGGQRYKLPATEQQTKHLLISRVLFENPKKSYLQSDIAYLTFKREFPAILRRIEYFKTEGYLMAAAGMPTGSKPYSALALRLQKMEAEVFTQILPTYTTAAHCTIHDSVLVAEDDKDVVLCALVALISDYGLPMHVRQ